MTSSVIKGLTEKVTFRPPPQKKRTAANLWDIWFALEIHLEVAGQHDDGVDEARLEDAPVQAEQLTVGLPEKNNKIK